MEFSLQASWCLPPSLPPSLLFITSSIIPLSFFSYFWMDCSKVCAQCESFPIGCESGVSISPDPADPPPHGLSFYGPSWGGQSAPKTASPVKFKIKYNWDHYRTVQMNINMNINIQVQIPGVKSVHLVSYCALSLSPYLPPSFLFSPSSLQEMTGWSRLLLIQSVRPGVCTSRLTGGVSRRTQTLSALTHRGGEAEKREQRDEGRKAETRS